MEKKKRVLISQPTRGLTADKIQENKRRAKANLEQFGYEVVTTFDTDEDLPKLADLPKEGVVNKRLFWLALAMARLSTCDTIYLTKGWTSSTACKLEHLAAFLYGLEILFEDPNEKAAPLN